MTLGPNELSNLAIVLARKLAWHDAGNALIQAGNESENDDVKDQLFAWADQARARRDECDAIAKVISPADSGQEKSNA